MVLVSDYGKESRPLVKNPNLNSKRMSENHFSWARMYWMLDGEHFTLKRLDTCTVFKVLEKSFPFEAERRKLLFAIKVSSNFDALNISHFATKWNYDEQILRTV